MSLPALGRSGSPDNSPRKESIMRLGYRHLLFVLALPLGCDSSAGAFQPDVSRLSRGAISWALAPAVNRTGLAVNADVGELFAPLSHHGSGVAPVIPAPAVPLQVYDSDPFMHYSLTIIKVSGETTL